MTAGPSGRRAAGEAGTPCVGFAVDTAVALADANLVGAFEGEGDAASMVAPRIAIRTIATALLSRVGRRRRVDIDARGSMTRQRTLSLADRVFRYVFPMWHRL